ncbi:amidohydrolase [Haloglomus litoreum]|uniref:amidohydrolase n=1 Tax=Haloglomus litoreum TaxID=3034026 RepID=UPI0023E7A673|nr:amidohydrolase [Haloglomus sp. DT116]
MSESSTGPDGDAPDHGSTAPDHLVALRRDLHRHPEPAWREFYTTARIVEELERIGVDELHLGPDAIDPDLRVQVPDAAELAEWRERALEAGADPDVVEQLGEGVTGAVAVVRQGDHEQGPTIALRVDIDALPRAESTDDDHIPAREGFRSETGAMHACGHDAHATFGIGVLERVKESDFEGTLKLLFQPAEEVIGGGKPLANSGHLDDVDYLLAVHVGLDHPTGEVVAGIDGFLAVTQLRAEFTGEGGHAGARPEEGRNAVQALATAVQNLYAIPRHSEGVTRINAGQVGGGTASNIIPEEAFLQGEVRGGTTELRDYMQERAEQVITSAAEMHACDADITIEGAAPSATSDESLVSLVQGLAVDIRGVESVVHRDDLGGSEDATELMRYVQERGGQAAYVCVGTDHPGGHHTATFDVDERSLPIGIDLLTESVLRIARERPDAGE